MIKADFYIYQEKFQRESNKSIDWFIRSWRFKRDSFDWQIARLFYQKYWVKAIDYLEIANKALKQGI